MTDTKNGHETPANGDNTNQETHPVKSFSNVEDKKNRLVQRTGSTDEAPSSSGGGGGTGPASQKRVFYAGVNSARNKFLDEANRATNTEKNQQRPEPKRMTPPRENTGAIRGNSVYESEPSQRMPGVVGWEEGSDGLAVKDHEIEMIRQQKQQSLANLKKVQQENGTSHKSAELSSEDFGVVDTKALKSRFLNAEAESSNRIAKINPAEEIIKIAAENSATIYENEPEESKFRQEEANGALSSASAKELREKFTEKASEKFVPKKFELDVGEGGVYENKPEYRADVIRNDFDEEPEPMHIPSNEVRANRMKFQSGQVNADANSDEAVDHAVKRQIDVKAEFSRTAGDEGAENTPEPSRADVRAEICNDASSGRRGSVELGKFKATSEARKALLEKQKNHNTEGKDRPDMVNIWDDLCADSGVFENEPKQLNQEVVRSSNDYAELAVSQQPTTEENE